MDKEFNLIIARKFAQKIKKQFPDAEVILFGSRATGENLLESDFDFLIVTDSFKNINFYQRIPLIYKLWDEEFGIEPLCYTKEEFQKKKNQLSIVSEALKQGIKI